MSNYPVGRRPRSADPQSKLRLAALTAVVAGVVLLAAAAFVLSYPGIHQVALQAGVSPSLAKLYPVIFDAMLVVAGAAAMTLRGAGWWSRFYAWACLIVLLVAVAVGDAVHATGTVLPARASRAAVAVTPWVLLLLAFGLLLTMLRHFRRARAAVAARQEARAAVAGDAGTGVRGRGHRRAAEANGTAAGRSAVTWAAASAAGTAAGAEGRALPQPLSGLDLLLGPRAGQAPAIEAPYDAAATDTGTGGDASHGDPVSYGEETGFVHPDSYRDEGEYSPHGDSGGPVADTAPGDPAQAGPASNGDAAPQQVAAPQQGTTADTTADTGADTSADTGEGDGPADAGAPESQADAAVAADGGPAGEQTPDGSDGEPAAAPGPGLERLRSSPTRPEE